jgi:16S rRNA G966 N2-methylase RsmD
MKKPNSDQTQIRNEISDRLEEMLKRYEGTRRAQNVSFRKMVPWLKVGERATHYIHSYPAKLLPHIAYFFLNAKQLSSTGDKVLDPFGGTGTVALESLLAGKVPLYCEMNPLAQLVAKVKTQSLNNLELDTAFRHVEISRRRYLKRKHLAPEVVHVDHWYEPTILKELSALKKSIVELESGPAKEFLLIAFSQTCRKMSNADPRLSVPVRRKHLPKRKPYATWTAFDEQVIINRKRYAELCKFLGVSEFTGARFVGNDARKLREPSIDFIAKATQMRKNTVQLVITSPPYAGAQKYVRATSLSLGWLDFAGISDLKPLENACIGREHFPKVLCRVCEIVGINSADRIIQRVFKINPLRSVIIATYLREMEVALKEIIRVLKPGGHLVIILGNNRVCGLDFKTSTYIRELAERYGLVTRLRLVDEIRSRGLMTKRNKTASVITREWVLVFNKPAEK